MKEIKKPQRMCIVCRQMKDKSELIRVVKPKEGAFSVDETGKVSGRGAYICLSKTCAEKLEKQKSLNKTFKTNVNESVYKTLKEAVFAKLK